MSDQKLTNSLENQAYDIYYEYLIEQNKVMNLTGITEKEDVYLKHFYDSLMATKYLDFNKKKVLDIGAGAGFPSIPILIKNPSMDLTIVDGLNKRIKFLGSLLEKINLSANLIHGRAEDLKVFNHFDIVLARAVAKLNILVEMALPVLKIDGCFLAFKSVHYQEELEESMNAIKKLGGEVEEIIQYDLSDELKHVYIKIRKVKNSPKGFPRSFAKIKKSPL